MNSPAIRTMPALQSDQVIELVRQRGVLRARDLGPAGIPRTVLSRLVDAGELQRVGRGLYILPDAELTEHHTLAEIARRVPDGVVNLLSALAFHGLTDEVPHRVWLALPRSSRPPKLDYPSLELTWSTPALLSVGVETHAVEGVPVRITGAARTVVDAFRHRRKVGIDVAVTALRDFLRLRKGTRDDLWRMAARCRARTVLRPYLEALS